MIYQKNKYKVTEFSKVHYGKAFRFKIQWCCKSGPREYIDGNAKFVKVPNSDFKVAVVNDCKLEDIIKNAQI